MHVFLCCHLNCKYTYLPAWLTFTYATHLTYFPVAASRNEWIFVICTTLNLDHRFRITILAHFLPRPTISLHAYNTYTQLTAHLVCIT